MNQIREYFERTVKISEADWNIFAAKLVRKQLPKKALLLKAGEIENHLSYIEKGIIRLFIPREENDLTFGFAFDRSFVSAYDSFLTQTPSGYHSQTLEETILWTISYRDLQDIYHQTEVGERIGRLASEDLFLRKSKRELSLLNNTAEERYLNLFTDQPLLVKKIPLQYIASYIGVTPQALSRIRRRIS